MTRRSVPEREHQTADSGDVTDAVDDARRAQVQRVRQAFAKVADLLEHHGQPSSRVYRAVADFADGLRAPLDDHDLNDLRLLAAGVPRISWPTHPDVPGDRAREPWLAEFVRCAHQAAAAAYALRDYEMNDR